MQFGMTTELILYGFFNLHYTSIIEGLHMAIKYYVKSGVMCEMMIALWCEKLTCPVFVVRHLWSLLACDIPVLP